MSDEIDTRPAVAPVEGMMAELRNGVFVGPILCERDHNVPFFVAAKYDWYPDGHREMRGLHPLDIVALHPMPSSPASAFPIGAPVEKISGSSWHGRVCGHYRTALTPDGVCVESEREPGSVQIYPAKALRLVPEDPK